MSIGIMTVALNFPLRKVWVTFLNLDMFADIQKLRINVMILGLSGVVIKKDTKRIRRNHHRLAVKLVNYMIERPLLTAKKDKLKKREKLTILEQEELNQIESEINSSVNTKTQILNDIIFPAMADLTFFFECLSISPELEAIFGKDVRELFGVIRKDPELWNYGFMFKRLVTAMILGERMSLIPHDDDDRYYRSDDFTLRLTHILQEIILQKISLTPKFKIKKASMRILEDISRGLAWTELLASRVNDPREFKEPNRTFDFDTVKILGLKVGH